MKTDPCCLEKKQLIILRKDPAEGDAFRTTRGCRKFAVICNIFEARNRFRTTAGTPAVSCVLSGPLRPVFSRVFRGRMGTNHPAIRCPAENGRRVPVSPFRRVFRIESSQIVFFLYKSSLERVWLTLSMIRIYSGMEIKPSRCAAIFPAGAASP